MAQTRTSALKFYGLLALAALLIAVHIFLVLHQPNFPASFSGVPFPAQ